MRGRGSDPPSQGYERLPDHDPIFVARTQAVIDRAAVLARRHPYRDPEAAARRAELDAMLIEQKKARDRYTWLLAQRLSQQVRDQVLAEEAALPPPALAPSTD